MSAKNIACIGHYHTCPKIEPGPRPHIGGPIIEAKQNFVRADGILIVAVGDKTLCTGKPGAANITKGSSFVNIDGKRIARSSDACEHGGTIVQGLSWINIE